MLLNANMLCVCILLSYQVCSMSEPQSPPGPLLFNKLDLIIDSINVRTSAVRLLNAEPALQHILNRWPVVRIMIC